MSDMRRLIESLDKLAEAASNVVPLPLGAPRKIDPGTHAFGQMGSVLTKPVIEPDQNNGDQQPAPKPTVAPGQKTLPGFKVTSIKPETPAYVPKQPWLDPQGSKEPAYMRKAVGATPAEPLGMIGGTGPDAKFEKLPGAANEPSIPKAPAASKSVAPRARVGAGSEYTNVYAPVKGSRPSFADVQYAKDLQRELEKTPDDPNLQAELQNLQRRGIVPKSGEAPEPGAGQEPELLPATQPNARDDMQNAMRRGGLPVPASSSASIDNVPSTVSPLRYGQETIPGMTREFKEFSKFLDNEFPVKSRKLKEQRKGMPQRPTEVTPLEFSGGAGFGSPTVSGPRVTPGPVPRVPANVEVPAYQRRIQPADVPQGVEAPKAAKPRLRVTDEPGQIGKTTPPANEPLATPPKVWRQNPERARQQAELRANQLGQVTPGADGKPIAPPDTSFPPKPLPGRPGSAMKQIGKVIPPAAIASQVPSPGDSGKDSSGGGGGGGSASTAGSTPSSAASSSKKPAVDLDRVMWVEPPANIDLPKVQGPITPGTTVPKGEEDPKATMMVPVRPKTQTKEPELAQPEEPKTQKAEPVAKPDLAREPSVTDWPSSSSGRITQPDLTSPFPRAGREASRSSSPDIGSGWGTGPGTGTGSGGGSGSGVGTGVGSGTGSGTGSDVGIGRSSPLKHGQETIPGMTKESLSRKFYNQFKNFMLEDDSSLGKFK